MRTVSDCRAGSGTSRAPAIRPMDSQRRVFAMKRLSLVLALVAASAVPAFAQIEGGTINGLIKDEQGGVLPGGTVTAQGGDATLTFVSDVSGEYRFLNLAPGPYAVTAALQGFTTVVRENVIVA